MKHLANAIPFAFLFLFVFNNFINSQNSSLSAIANAKLTISIKGKTAYCTTNEKGEFAISLSFISQTFEDRNMQPATIKVELLEDFKGKVKNKNLTVHLRKQNAPYYEFILYSKEVMEPNNEVELVCEQIEKNQTKSQPQKKNEIHRGKGDASKPGDKYMGQVAHF